ncbi:MAG: RidA family protein [Terriglobia bacterium]|jgi:2-iminobutanoate/2-iminopropanoate deaminase
MNKIGMKLVVLAIAHLTAVLLTAAGRPVSSAKRAINPPGTAEGLPFSNGILVGNTLYVAGQEGSDDGRLRPGGIGPETQAALENIKKIVELAGLQMEDVVSVNVYLADLADFGEMNKVYKTFFPAPRPARATVQVAALVNHARIEITAIAVKTR